MIEKLSNLLGKQNISLKMMFLRMNLMFFGLLLSLCVVKETLGIRLFEGGGNLGNKGSEVKDQQYKITVFALGSFWRGEAAFGCVPGVIRTTAGYSGGTKLNPEYRLLGDHAEAVQVEYDPKLIRYEQLLNVFWSNHDATQVFGQGPDVGDQYRSIIFTSGNDEAKLAALSKEREQTKIRDNLVTTQIQEFETFYPAEPEHQKFELRQNSLLLQLIGMMPEEEFARSSMATKLNSYAAGMCAPSIRKTIDAKVNDILKSWPLSRLLQEV
ncbi:peptide methionine sulfoxide reductase A5 isoform X2 [Cryptomeria japonica]|uniref:peptide methionine sulfoxide reductase A5 isoform X2 n=1 Tax=Cryptomeria japonica TaxID=3369 RepID=UPI0025ABEA7A|nr:peptide methionine sulfoxide reductase A5 isoform X2 [Cryptomeria japonica]